VVTVPAVRAAGLHWAVNAIGVLVAAVLFATTAS